MANESVTLTSPSGREPKVDRCSARGAVELAFAGHEAGVKPEICISDCERDACF